MRTLRIMYTHTFQMVFGQEAMHNNAARAYVHMCTRMLVIATAAAKDRYLCL